MMLIKPIAYEFTRETQISIQGGVYGLIKPVGWRDHLRFNTGEICIYDHVFGVLGWDEHKKILSDYWKNLNIKNVIYLK